MYANTMRLSVKHDDKDPLRALLPLVGAVRTARNERPCQVCFIEDGVSLLRQPIDGGLSATGWPSLGEVLKDVTDLDLEVYACTGCAQHRSVPTTANDAVRVQWLPASDLRFPLHMCGGPIASKHLVTIELQRREQAVFDARVGKPTVGAREAGGDT
jgi:hypothetical protein